MKLFSCTHTPSLSEKAVYFERQTFCEWSPYISCWGDISTPFPESWVDQKKKPYFNDTFWKVRQFCNMNPKALITNTCKKGKWWCQYCIYFKLKYKHGVHTLTTLPGFTLYSKVRVPLEVIAVTCRFVTVGTSSAREVSSWKWVANKQKQWIFVAMFLEGKLKVKGILFNWPILLNKGNNVSQS